MVYLAIKWWIFPWQTVSHNQMVYVYIYTYMYIYMYIYIYMYMYIYIQLFGLICRYFSKNMGWCWVFVQRVGESWRSFKWPWTPMDTWSFFEDGAFSVLFLMHLPSDNYIWFIWCSKHVSFSPKKSRICVCHWYFQYLLTADNLLHPGPKTR